VENGLPLGIRIFQWFGSLFTSSKMQSETKPNILHSIFGQTERARKKAVDYSAEKCCWKYCFG